MKELNNELIKWSEQFESYHLPRWDELPNIDYYMDQVIEYIKKYVEIFCEEDTKIITPAMINNYVKLGLLPAPIKKKYSKVHISILIVITIIKQVTVISQIKEAIEFQMSLEGGRNAYNVFCIELENSLKGIYTTISNSKIEISQEISADNVAVKCISNALASKLISIKATEISYNTGKGE